MQCAKRGALTQAGGDERKHGMSWPLTSDLAGLTSCGHHTSSNGDSQYNSSVTWSRVDRWILFVTLRSFVIYNKGVQLYPATESIVPLNGKSPQEIA